MPENTPSLQDHLKHAIESGELSMVPRWRVFASSLLIIAGVVVSIFAILFVSSFTVFVLRQTGLWMLPAPRMVEALPLLSALPWLFFAVVIACAAILYVLVRRFSLSYSHPLVYSMGAILLLAVGGGIALGHTPLHPFLYDQARHDRLPFAGHMYRGYEVPHSSNVAVGIILERTGSGFLLSERDGTVTVIINEQTRLPREGLPSDGEVVSVIGERDDEIFQAYGIRPLRDGLSRPTPRFRRAPPPPRALIPEPR